MRSGARTVRPGPQELATGLHSLATLLASGMPLPRVLNSFETIAPYAWRPVVGEIRDSVRNGRSLSSAIEESALMLPPALIGLVRAGEERGALAESIGKAAHVADGQARTRREIVSALSYPLLLLIAGLGALGVMIFVVLPRFSSLLVEADLAVPRFTRIMLAAGAAVSEYWVYVAGAALGVVLLARTWLRESANRVAWNRALLALPIVGPIRLRLASARLCSTLAGLLQGGVPLVRALDVSAGTVGDDAIADRVRQARRAIVGGASAAAALGDAEAMSDTALSLVAAGETSGRLAEMLTHAASIDHAAATEHLRLAARVLEPALVLAIGGMVAAIAAGLLQTIYTIRP